MAGAGDDDDDDDEEVILSELLEFSSRLLLMLLMYNTSFCHCSKCRNSSRRVASRHLFLEQCL